MIHREALVKAVRPVAWQDDCAYLPLAVAGDMAGSRDGDMRDYHLVGNLPWALHNDWWHYRHSMDGALLRDTLYPLLRRAVNPYLRLASEADDGTLRLPPTCSPDTGLAGDCNIDLAQPFRLVPGAHRNWPISTKKETFSLHGANRDINWRL